MCELCRGNVESNGTKVNQKIISTKKVMIEIKSKDQINLKFKIKANM